jgi:RNA polymerase sigma-70 factor, ECF subfamily
MQGSAAVLSHETVGAARAGDHDAITDIYQALAPAVIGYLRGSGVADPENAAGDVFLGAIRGLPTFAGDATALRSWVFTIAHRRVLDDRRRRRRKPEWPLGSRVVLFAAADETEGVLDAIASAPLRDALARLTPDQRSAVLLRVVAGLSLEESAAAMGKTVPAVKMLQHRALSTLARTIQREAVT